MTHRIARGSLNNLKEIAFIFDQYRIFYGAQSDLNNSEDFIKARFDNEDAIIFIAFTENDGIIGFTQLYPTFSSVSMKKVWILNDLFVMPTMRKSGIGRSLIEYAINYAKADGAIRVSLSTARDNPAQYLYEKIGFTESSFKFYNFAL